ncbi:MAG TPA: hypothetical protein VLD19_11685 [Chitinophagaceae bacterium]|nr:hypothetical protein [Chitinophagaceae bacterium]
MARQVGPIYLTRTIDGVIFYKMAGKYYVRMAPCFPDIRRSPRFAGTMQSARRMGRASKIGAYLYAALRIDHKHFGMYRVLVGEAAMLLKTGLEDQEVLERVRLQGWKLLAQSGQIAAAVYGFLPDYFRRLWMLAAYEEEAREMLKAGKGFDEVFRQMWDVYASEFMPGYREEADFEYADDDDLPEMAEFEPFKTQLVLDVLPLRSIVALRGWPERPRRRTRVMKRCYEELRE